MGLFILVGLGSLWILIDLPEPWKSKVGHRLADGKSLRVEQYAEYYSWFGALANLLLAALFLATSRWWRRWTASSEPLAYARSQPPRRFLWGVVIAVIVAAGLRVPLMNGPLQRDEEDTLCRDIWGCYEEQADRSWIRKPVPWSHTFWENGGANNPVFFSVLSRSGLEIWSFVTGAHWERFSRWVLRWPSLVAGLGCVALTAVWLARLGFWRVGLFAAFLLAIHPWHIRYSIEARGYSMAMAFAMGGFILLHAALKSGTWRAWSGFAACQFGMLWSFPGAVYIAFVQSFLALGALFLRHRTDLRNLSDQSSRMLLTNALGGMAFIQLMSPCVPQMLRYLEKSTAFGSMGLPWLWEFVGLITAGVGMGWYDGHPPGEYGPLFDLSRIPDGLGLFLFTLLLIPLLAVIGGVALSRTGRAAGTVTAAMSLGPLLSFIHNKSNGHYLYPWYLILALPPFVCWVAAGLNVVTRLLPEPRVARAAFLGFGLCFLAVFWEIGSPWRLHSQPASNQCEIDLVRGNKVYTIYPQGYVVHRLREAPPNP